MLHPFNWHHSLYYGEKWNLSDFDTKNPKSLNHLLKQMYMLGYKNGHFLMKNSLPAFNAAYYVAVAISNTEGIDETNLEEEAEEILEEEKFLVGIPNLVSKWEYRYNTELTPHPLHPKYYTDFMWTNTSLTFRTTCPFKHNK